MSHPKHAWAVAGHDRVAGRSFYPHVPSLLGRPSGVVSESLTGGDDLPEDGPDGRPVSVDVFTNPHRGILTEGLSLRFKQEQFCDGIKPIAKLSGSQFTLAQALFLRAG